MDFADLAKALSNEYFVMKFRFDTAENEPPQFRLSNTMYRKHADRRVNYGKFSLEFENNRKQSAPLNGSDSLVLRRSYREAFRCREA